MKDRFLNKEQLFDIKLNVICLLLILAVFSVDLKLPLGVAGGVPYIVVILASLWSSKKNLVIYLAVICSVMILLGFYLSPTGGELWKVISNRTLALFAVWITALLALKWKRHEAEIISLNLKIEKEKEVIYLATIHGAQHITNNLLNELKVVEIEIENTPGFDKEVALLFANMTKEANKLLKDLSSVEEVDDSTIRESIYPK